MKVSESYYDILHISTNASKTGIINAYREIKLIFQADSVAAYSLYSAEEITAISLQIEEAYAILSNSETRRVYDKTLHISKQTKLNEKSQKDSLHLAPKDNIDMPFVQSTTIPHNVCGKTLRTLRESHAITLEHIANKTKISIAHLKAIEANDASAFPGVFYLKSYLKQYASSIGLEPCLTWEKYLKNLKNL